MYGREAYHRPWMLAEVDSLFAGQADPVASRSEAVIAMLPYIEEQLASGIPLHRITRHMLGLFHGMPGGRRWRQLLSGSNISHVYDLKLILQALPRVEGEQVAAE